MATRRDLELWEASRIVTQHGPEDVGCKQCTPNGCRLYDWAGFMLRQWEAEHGQQYPRAPSWQAAAAGRP